MLIQLRSCLFFVFKVKYELTPYESGKSEKRYQNL